MDVTCFVFGIPFRQCQAHFLPRRRLAIVSDRSFEVAQLGALGVWEERGRQPWSDAMGVAVWNPQHGRVIGLGSVYLLKPIRPQYICERFVAAVSTLFVS